MFQRVDLHEKQNSFVEKFILGPTDVVVVGVGVLGRGRGKQQPLNVKQR